MKIRKTIAVAGVAALALLGTACGKDDKSSDAGKAPSYEVNDKFSMPDSKTWKAAKDRGHLIVGAKEDQPFLGFMDPATKERSGFDIEMARMISAELGLDPKKIEFKTIASANRETALQKGDVDIYVGTYSITDKRKESVGFAGPYYISGQSLLVKKDNTAITGKDTIANKKVCSAKGSTPAQKITKDFPTTTLVEYDTYSLCVDNLLSGQVDAVTTDEAILKGYAAKDPKNLKVVGENFSTEKYGIGVSKDDAQLREAVNKILEESNKEGVWKNIYDATLGLSGARPRAAPRVAR
ncbi:glutamate ABC transporter substrate-binding protein [Yinghuangia soli]|uniref:Glutamate ABC transporter substrate-binding protein n=1 Tax=Yinghuangia soli TaxID=2908204 RepID=A0AA41Q976_9ACTN|nr:glutamate ABC transporter substrate-binding protein [Yinghuangia soli]MCF2533076.1 glutamate ABC transporter substrate-binding protein [Yinghuangia soli]